MRERLAALTLEQKVRLLTGADFWALHAEPAAGLRRLVISDGPAGVRGERWDEREPSANVPSPTALAATWDEARIERLGRLLAAEARSKGVDVVLAPMINLHRTPYGGRCFECFSEDPLLTGAHRRRLRARAAGRGRRPRRSSTSSPTTARPSASRSTPAWTSARCASSTSRRSRRSCATPAPWTVMAAYNAVNGVTMTESPLLRDVLHEEWGLDGLVMSDWGAARTTVGAGAGTSTSRCPARTGRGATTWSPRSAAGEVERGASRREGAAAAAPGRPGRRAGRRCAGAPPARPWTRTRSPPSCARPPPRVRADPQRRAAAARPTRAQRRGARAERRRGSHARRRQRDGVPAVHGVAARRAARGARRRVRRSRTRPACARTRPDPAGRARCCCPDGAAVRRRGPLPRRRRPCWPASSAEGARSPGSARSAPACRRGRRRARSRCARGACAATAAGTYRSAAPASGASG